MMQSELGPKTEEELIELASRLFSAVKQCRKNFKPPSGSHLPKNTEFSDLDIRDKKIAVSYLDSEFKPFIECYPIVAQYMLENDSFHRKAFEKLLKRIAIIDSKPQQHREKGYSNKMFVESRSAYAFDLVMFCASRREKKDRNTLRKRAMAVRQDAARAIEEAQKKIETSHEEAKVETRKHYGKLQKERILELLNHLREDWDENEPDPEVIDRFINTKLAPGVHKANFKKTVLPELLLTTTKRKEKLDMKFTKVGKGKIDEATVRSAEQRKLQMIEHVDEKDYEKFPKYLKHKPG
jgi:hypothetical protein